MIFRPFVAFCLGVLLALASGPVRADLTDQQPSYTRIAAKCGEDPSQPYFSQSEYAGALADAAKAMKAARQTGGRSLQTAIAQSVARLKECMASEDRKYYLPKVQTCDEFTGHFISASAWSAKAIAEGRITPDYRDRLIEMLRAPAEACVRRLMSKCIDPNSASQVDDALRAMMTATHFGFVYSFANETGLDFLALKYGPGTMRLTFCTDTDYACSADPDYCAFKVARIKSMLNAYVLK
jgi:hypothetical protein